MRIPSAGSMSISFFFRAGVYLDLCFHEIIRAVVNPALPISWICPMKTQALITSLTVVSVATLVLFFNAKPPPQFSIDSWRNREEIGAGHVINYGWPQITVTSYSERGSTTKTLVNRAAIIPNLIALIVAVYMSYLVGSRIGNRVSATKTLDSHLNLRC